jgi:hypothetical protein
MDIASDQEALTVTVKKYSQSFRLVARCTYTFPHHVPPSHARANGAPPEIRTRSVRSIQQRTFMRNETFTTSPMPGDSLVSHHRHNYFIHLQLYKYYLSYLSCQTNLLDFSFVCVGSFGRADRSFSGEFLLSNKDLHSTCANHTGQYQDDSEPSP